MSIWSRNPKDLAKLARTLQSGTDHTRPHHGQADTQATERTRRPRSLSPRTVATQGNTPTSNLDKDHPKTVERRSPSQDHWSASVSGAVSTTENYEQREAETRRLTTPKLTVTDEHGSSFDALEAVEASTQHGAVFDSIATVCQQTDDSVHASDRQKKMETSVRDGPPEQKGARDESNSSSIVLKSPQADASDAKCCVKENKNRVKESADTVNTKREEDTTRTESPEMINYQNLSTEIDRLSPRLAARSPDLLKKLKEVTSTISSKKSFREHKRPLSADYRAVSSSSSNISAQISRENRRPVTPSASVYDSPSPKKKLNVSRSTISPENRFLGGEESVDNDDTSSLCSLEDDVTSCADVSFTKTGQKFTAQLCNKATVKPIAIRIDANRPRSGFRTVTKPTEPENRSPHCEQGEFVSRKGLQGKSVLTALESEVNTQSSKDQSSSNEYGQDDIMLQHMASFQETSADEPQCVLCESMNVTQTPHRKLNVSHISKSAEPNTNTTDHSVVAVAHTCPCSSQSHQQKETVLEDKQASATAGNTFAEMTTSSTQHGPPKYRAVSPIPQNLHHSPSADVEKSRMLISPENTEMSISVPMSVSEREPSPSNSKLYRDELSSQRSTHLLNQHHLSSCCSSLCQSPLTTSEMGSESDEYSSVSMNYLTSSSHSPHHQRQTVSQKRLQKMIQTLRQHDQFTSFKEVDADDLKRTISELQHVCLCLSAQLEGHDPQQTWQDHQHRNHHRKGQEKVLQKKQQVRLSDSHSVQEQQHACGPWEVKRKARSQRRSDGNPVQTHSHQLQQHRQKQDSQVPFCQHHQKQDSQVPLPRHHQKLEDRQHSFHGKKREQQQTSTGQRQAVVSAKLPTESQELLRRQTSDASKTDTQTGNFLKTYTLDSRTAQKSYSASSKDSDKTLQDKAIHNTHLLDLLGVDRDLLVTDDHPVDEGDRESKQQQLQTHDSRDTQEHERQLSDGKGGSKKTEKRSELRLSECESFEHVTDTSDFNSATYNEEEEEEEEGGEDGGEESQRRKSAEERQSSEKERLELDEDFDRMMKTIEVQVRKLPQKSGRGRCVAWIRKIRSSEALDSADKKKRNERCLRMLSLLERGSLSHTPFSTTTTDHAQLAEHTRHVEARYQGKIQRLRQDHEAALQKITEQKNSEVETVRSQQVKKMQAMQDTIRILHSKVKTLTENMESVRQSKDREILELQERLDGEVERSIHEQMIQDVESAFAEETCDLERGHVEELSQLLQDTNARLQRLEEDYSHKAAESRTSIKELQSRVQQLTGQLEDTSALCSLLHDDKQHLQRQVASLSAGLHSQRYRKEQLQRQQQTRLESLEKGTKALDRDAEVYLDLLNHQHTTAAAKATETITELQQRVVTLGQTIAEAERDWSRQVKDREKAHQEDKQRLCQLHTEQMDTIKEDAADLHNQLMPRLSSLQQRLRDKEEELQRQMELNKEQVTAVGKVQEDVQRHAEQQQSLRLAGLQKQLDQMKTEAEDSYHALREDSAVFDKQMEEEKQRYQQKLTVLTKQHDEERWRTLQATETATTQAQSAREAEVARWQRHRQEDVEALQEGLQQGQDKAVKMAEELLTKVSQLTEEVEHRERKRKEEVRELQQLWEEERLKMQRDYNDEISQYRLEMELQSLALQKTHWTEMGRLLERIHHILSKDKMVLVEKELQSVEGRDLSIPSLKSRVNRLQQKADRLQEELTLPIHLSLDWL